MNDFEVIEWPEIQELMDKEGFEDNTALINSNENLGIYSSTYLVSKKWLREIEYA